MQKKKDKQRVKVGFVALGCPKNIVDSEKMLAEIAEGGFVITSNPDNCDVVVINTCGFIEPAKAEAIEVIRHSLECKAKGKVGKVVVAGCLPQRMGKKLLDEVKGIDAVMGLEQRDNIVKVIKKVVEGGRQNCFINKDWSGVHSDKARLLIGGKHWAYLRISEGCDHKCSFCTIPSIRGKFRSKPVDEIIEEAKELAAAGVVELNLIAQDTTYYGKDLKIRNGLAVLIRELEKIDGIKWIRVMYLYPSSINDTLIDTIAGSDKMVHYLDIPFQHISENVLKRMNRPAKKEFILKLIERLRKAMPDIVLRTTFIVGFPGETDEQFEELVEFIRWAKFDALGCFKYYAEEGTVAANLNGQIPEDVKEKKLERLMLAQQEIIFDKNKRRVGQKLYCLIDFVNKQGEGKGRFFGQAPEIDSICMIENCLGKAGELVKVKVVGTKDYDLVVRQI